MHYGLILMIIPALICGLMFTNCSGDKNEKPEVQQEEQQDLNTEGGEANGEDFDFAHDKIASIVGNWKLLKERIPFTSTGPITRDYSQDSIVYEFKQDGTLIVSENAKNYGLHESGKYSFIKDEWGMGLGDYPWGLKINQGQTNWYRISSEELIIDGSPLDGSTLYFVKI